MKQIYIKTFKDVLTAFNENNVRYCVLRNYEFLFDSSAPMEGHLDIIIHGDDMKKASALLQEHGGIPYPPQFSRKHQGQGIYVRGYHVKVGFDIQADGVYWNDIPYLSGADVVARRKLIDFVYVLSDEDALIMYICHSILGKRLVKEKYAKIMLELFGKCDLSYVETHLATVFNKRRARFIMHALEHGDISALEKRAYSFVVHFLVTRPRHWISFVLLSLRWFFNRKYCPLRHIPLLRALVPGFPLISFIGPDGAGKSSNALRLAGLLNERRFRASLVYAGRGNANVLPVKKLGSVYMKHERLFGQFLRKIIATAAVPLYMADLLIRYFRHVVPQRRKEIVVTDRYFSDIFLMKHVPLIVRKAMLLFFPKPTLTFYLYNDVATLSRRRANHPAEDLERQMKLYKILSNSFDAVEIKTSHGRKDFDKIAEATIRMLIGGGW